MRALVTGGAGFIGSNVVKLLISQGYSVVVLDNLSTGYMENLLLSRQMTFVKGDLRDPAVLAQAMQGVDVVFHLAASVGNVRSLQDPLFDSDVNVLGTLRVLEIARALGVRKLVYSSSAAIYGEPRYLPINEGHPAEPDSPYGVSKLAGEKQCLCYARLYGLAVVCLRYFNVYGIGQRYDAYGNVIPIFTSRLLNQRPIIIYGDGEQTRDFVNVSDVADANLLAAQTEGVSGAFNVGCGTSIGIKKLSEILREIVGLAVSVRYESSRKGDVRHSEADISAAKQILGYIPGVTLRDGLEEYVRWMKSEGVGSLQ